MVADVPVGTFLSGGLDSSAITAFAKNMVGSNRLKCFTISFDDKLSKLEGVVSDLPYAKKLGETSLMFLVHPTLTKEEIQKTCDVLTEVALAN